MSDPGIHNYTNMLCALAMLTLRVTGVPTQVKAHRQVGRNTIGTTTPQTAMHYNISRRLVLPRFVAGEEEEWGWGKERKGKEAEGDNE